MLKQLAPMAVMPPSPKNSAWMTRAAGDPHHRRPGPQHHAPSGSPHGVSRGAARHRDVEHLDGEAEGREHGHQRRGLAAQASPSPSCWPGTRRADAAPYASTAVAGLRYPSGMCMASPVKLRLPGPLQLGCSDARKMARAGTRGTTPAEGSFPAPPGIRGGGRSLPRWTGPDRHPCPACGRTRGRSGGCGWPREAGSYWARPSPHLCSVTSPRSISRSSVRYTVVLFI